MSLRNLGLPWLEQPFDRWFYFGQCRPKCFGPLPRPKFRSGLWFLLTSIQPPFLLHTWLLATPRPNPVTIHLNAHTYVDWDECALNLDSVHFAKSTSSADARKPDQTTLNADWIAHWSASVDRPGWPCMLHAWVVKEAKLIHPQLGRKTRNEGKGWSVQLIFSADSGHTRLLPSCLVLEPKFENCFVDLAR